MNGRSDHDGLDTRKVAGEAKRRARRKRTTGPTRLRQINAKAREREAAWLEGDQANLVARLTTDLTEAYDGLRTARREVYAKAPQLEGRPVFKGVPGGRS